MSEQAKNMIWVLTDQQPAHMLGCNGNPNLSTPNLDRFANSGINCNSAVSGYPLCCPFRGSMLTSRYPHKCVPGHEYRMDPQFPTVATAFKNHNYHTAYFGKWHVDGFHEKKGRAAMHIVPPKRRGGFDKWVGYENNNSQFDCWVHGGEGEDEFHYRLPGYETDCLTDLLIEYIKGKNADKQNFFAVLSVQPPHNPYIAPAEYMRRHRAAEIKTRQNVPDVKGVIDKARTDLAGAYAMVENMDWNFGRIISALEETGLLEDTNIIYFSDHGDMHGSHGQFKKTAPWEEAIRIPFIIGGGKSYYGTSSANRDIVINHVDIAPTSLGLCGLPVPNYMEGFDYSQIRFQRPYDDSKLFPESAFIQSIMPTAHGHSIDQSWRCIVTRDKWKYVAIPYQHWLMYNLNDDPYEQVNLAFNKGYRGMRIKLFDQLAAWIEKTGDEFPLPGIDYEAKPPILANKVPSQKIAAKIQRNVYEEVI